MRFSYIIVEKHGLLRLRRFLLDTIEDVIKTPSIEDAMISKPFWFAVSIVDCSILGLYVRIDSSDWFGSETLLF